MKCVITRDKRSGVLEFWSANEEPKIKKDCGIWEHDNGKDSLACVEYCCTKGVCKLLGFTPRKGSKQLVEITVKKLGGGEKGR